MVWALLMVLLLGGGAAVSIRLPKEKQDEYNATAKKGKDEYKVLHDKYEEDMETWEAQRAAKAFEESGSVPSS